MAENQYEKADAAGNTGEPGDAGINEDCGTITDPIRRTLCKVCGVPVIGSTPFCSVHEHPVP